ncbi:probable receptor-like protein kinase At1g49730 [Primulina huaijiensis]|uniref:probable receptor-like protein kinase At1g49730 n=1 Tax=Primulina huaijiensis TaxID=1492673 RepID=UPI003CC6E196
MGSENLVLKIRLLLFSWFHLRSKLGSPSLVKCFSYNDIKKATDGFKRVIHNSPEGDSYKAVFRNGLVARVKEVKAIDEEDDDFFYREVELLGCLNHRHIVALIGFSTGCRRFLVFENSEDTSLMEHLSDPLKTPLNWRTRLQIAIGVAAALEYLHFFCDPPVYLVSLSSRTILLDENLIPKISDVGFLGSAGNDVLPTSSCCSKGCTKQECKNMIFQLGLLILELVTGQSSETGGVDLAQWVQESNFPRSMHKMIDPDLGNNYDQGELVGLLKVARLCIRSVDKTRIHTPQILWYLQKKVGIVRK